MIRLFKIYLTLAFLLVTTFCMAQKSELKFSKDGKFKIVQFTDVLRDLFGMCYFYQCHCRCV